MRFALCLFVVMAALGTGSSAQERRWYYCDTTHEFYPHVQQCSVPWRAVRPYKPVPLGQPTNIVPQAGQETAEPEQAPAAPEQTPEQEREAAQAKAQADAQAAEQAQAKRAAYEHDRAIEKAKEKGYELIPSVKDLILDGKELAAREAKIQIAGFYRKFGEGAEALYDSVGEAYADSDNKFPILTDDAQRDLRKYLMEGMCGTAIGCLVEVGGHVTTCTHTFAELAAAPPAPCLRVEVQIVYRPGD